MLVRRGLEENADKTKYMIMSRNQNAGQSHNINIDDSTFERVKEFKYYGTTLTNQNSIQEEIKSKFKSGNVCHLSMQKLLSFRLLSKNLKLRYTEVQFCFCLAWGETWSLTMRGEKNLGLGCLRIGC